MWLTRFAISRPMVTAAIFIALAIAGAIAFSRIGRSANPPGTDYPLVIVAAGYPGASPQTMEKLVVKPIEDQLVGTQNMDQVTATTQEGSAVVLVRFKLGTNLDIAAIDVQRRVDTARVYMPADMDPPSVQRNGASQPLLDLALSSSTLSPMQLADLTTNQIEPMLQEIPNVQTVDVYGLATRQFNVRPNPAALDGIGATLGDVFNAVAGNNANLPGGLLEQPTREATVSIRSGIESASDIADIPLVVPGVGNRNLRVGDVATVDDGHIEMRSISHYNGQPRLYVSLGRAIGADEITTTQVARAHIQEIEKQFPQVTFHEIDAPADFTQKSLVGVWQSLFEGVVLTAIVMMLFLHAWRNAAVVMISIPTSILSTFVLMNAFGFHIDSMSMMGLALIIGILVDDSIVVLENITRHREMGKDSHAAAVDGRTEIGGAAIAITMVDVVVFLPIAFLPGIVGAYLKEYAAVVVIATLFSLLVSFTLTPMLAAFWSVKKIEKEPPRWLAALDTRRAHLSVFLAAVVLFALGAIFRATILNVFGVFALALLLLNLFVHRYTTVLDLYRTRLLPAALRHGSFVAFVCAVLLVNALSLVGSGKNAIGIDAVVLLGTLAVYGYAAILRRRGSLRPWMRGIASLGSHRPTAIATLIIPPVLAVLMVALGGINFDFVPAEQTGHIRMTLAYTPGTPIGVTAKGVDAIEKAIMKLPGVKSVSSTVGRMPSGWGSLTGGNYAQLDANMHAADRGDTNATIAKIRPFAALAPGGDFQVAGDTGGGSGQPIFYAVQGPDNEIDAAAEKVANVLRETKGSVNVQTSAEVAAPELRVAIERGKAILLGVSPAAAAEAARIAIAGAVATRVRTPNGLIDVYVQFPKADRHTLAQLENVKVRASDGTLVPLGDVARFRWEKAPTKIERYDRQRVVNVLGDVLPGYALGAVVAPLEKKLREPGFLPAGVHLKAQGDTQFLSETLVNMGIALLTSFGLVYLLMVILYGNLLEPLIVMFSVPVAIVGALMLLAFMGHLPGELGQSLNIISMLGIVMLFGLVAKNGILLVDYSNTLCKRGMRVREAVLEAAATRFRPILMTTAAMIFGMLPLALGFAEGAEWRQAMGTVIIGGLLSSLVLTLFLVPMIYNTWMGALERRADRRAVRAELSPVGATH